MIAIMRASLSASRRPVPRPGAAGLIPMLVLLTACAGGGNRAGDAEAWSEAIGRQDLTALEEMLDTNQDPDRAGSGGKTALMIAAQAGDRDLVARLIEAGADVNARNEHLGTPLMFAATGGSVPVTRALIERGAQVDAVAQLGWTPLLLAAAKGNTEAALLLIGSGADPNLADGYGWTPLMRAITGRHGDTVRALLATGSMDLGAREESGATALHIAAGEGQADMVAALLAAGADPALPDGAGRTPAAVARIMGHQGLAARLTQAEPADRPPASGPR
jgi:ankyrin repeat protein